MDGVRRIESLAELEALYSPAPNLASTAKEVPVLIPAYRRLIEASPFATLATSGPQGLDCSPRGDLPGFVRVHDARTLLMPDRRGNNRIDSLRNVVRDPRVALLFLIPGLGTTLRVNGRGWLTDDAALRESFAVEGKAPRTVLVIEVESVYFQCARAIVRAGLWDPARQVEPGTMPTPGAILQELSRAEIDGESYDAAWPERARQTMW